MNQPYPDVGGLGGLASCLVSKRNLNYEQLTKS